MNPDKTFIIIPALNPEAKRLAPLVEELIAKGYGVVLVDDGSDAGFRELFFLAEKKGAVVLRHAANMGKGRAIKTALNFILTSYDEIAAVITADSDGQHSVTDIAKVAEEVNKYPECYVLGCRNFDADDVPARSRWGNKITRLVFKIFVGLSLTDTQTGLRGMAPGVARKLLLTKGERYEYETNALIDCAEADITIKEVPIATIYHDANKGSHFNALTDSWRIYRLFLKYMIVSLSSFLVDLLLFVAFYKLFTGAADAAFFATILARLFSSLYNFLLNRRAVFRKQNRTSLVRYYVLAGVNMLVSAVLVNFFSRKYKAVVIVKVIVDAIIFIINFIIQREWVFRAGKTGE